jgi:5-methylcytosine-specific restriction endonuclease McrA
MLPALGAKPGAVRPEYRTAAWQQTARRIAETAESCWICGRGPVPGDPFECDHVVPLALGGTNDESNLQAAHASCNRRRGGQLAHRIGRSNSRPAL